MSRTLYEPVAPGVADESGNGSNADTASSYQQSTGGAAESSSVNGEAVKRGSGLSATLAEVPNIFAAFG